MRKRRAAAEKPPASTPRAKAATPSSGCISQLGGFLFAPRNRRHAYRNIGSAAARLLVFAIPGTGLDRMFAAFDAASKRAAGMPSIDTIAAIAEQYGVVVHPPAGLGTKGVTTAA